MITKLAKETRLYGLESPIIGLTGGIATGKSTVAKLLKERNIPLICADTLIKSIYAWDESFLFVEKNFREAIEEKRINFKKLRETVFADPSKLRTLESYLHPLLEHAFLKEYRRQGNPPYIIYDMPILFEKEFNKLVDLVVCVYAPRAIQMERLMKRDSITTELAEKMLGQQIDIETKKSMSDFILHNEADEEILTYEVEALIHRLGL